MSKVIAISESKLREIIAESVEEMMSEMEAYHGSSSRFMNFDARHMGSGEGGSEYGWGTYVTTNPSTGEHYAKVAMDANGKSNGYLYQVQIPDDNGRNYLNIKGNPIAVYTQIEKILIKEFPNINKEELHNIIRYCRDPKYDSLDWFFHQIMACGVSYRGVSRALYRNGFIGVRVPVQYREAGIGNEGYNYTMFNPRDVKIIKRRQV